MNNTIAIANRQKDDWKKKLREEVQITKGAPVTRTAERDVHKAAQVAAAETPAPFFKHQGKNLLNPRSRPDEAVEDDAPANDVQS